MLRIAGKEVRAAALRFWEAVIVRRSLRPGCSLHFRPTSNLSIDQRLFIARVN
jgi:hypothetical protein